MVGINFAFPLVYPIVPFESFKRIVLISCFPSFFLQLHRTRKLFNCISNFSRLICPFRLMKEDEQHPPPLVILQKKNKFSLDLSHSLSHIKVFTTSHQLLLAHLSLPGRLILNITDATKLLKFCFLYTVPQKSKNIF